MRWVSRATCTSGEPVSFSWVWYCSITAAFSSVCIIVRFSPPRHQGNDTHRVAWQLPPLMSGLRLNRCLAHVGYTPEAMGMNRGVRCLITLADYPHSAARSTSSAGPLCFTRFRHRRVYHSKTAMGNASRSTARTYASDCSTYRAFQAPQLERRKERQPHRRRNPAAGPSASSARKP